MNRIVFNCKTITPMFSGDALQDPEIRPTEIKAAMRFWWRAIQSYGDLTQLRKAESELFGGAWDDRGKQLKPQKAKFNIDIVCAPAYNRNDNLWSLLEVKYIPPPERRNYGKYKGIAYLFYSINFGANRNRHHIPAGHNFQIHLSATTDQTLISAIFSLWLVVWFGAVGSRSRKGAGSFEVTSIDLGKNRIEPLPSFIYDGSAPLVEWLRLQFNLILSALNNSHSKPLYNYSKLSKEIIISNKTNHSDWMEALNEIGDHYESFRKENRTKDFEKLSFFGLPLSHTRGGTVKPANDIYSKRSAPFAIKVFHIPDNGFAWMLLQFDGDFLPNGEMVKLERARKLPDKALYDQYFNSLKRSSISNTIIL